MGKTLSSLMAKVVYVAKMQNLKNSSNFDCLERFPKINNSHIEFFLGIGTLLCPGSTTFQKPFFQVFFGPPTLLCIHSVCQITLFFIVSF